MNRYLSVLAAPAALLAAAPSGAAVLFTVTGTTQSAPVFNRPVAATGTPAALSTVGTAVSYNTFFCAAPTAGNSTFSLTSTAADYDPFLVLYSGSFDASQPLANVLAANDDGVGTGNALLTRALAAGTGVTAVITGFDNGDFGTYALTVSEAAVAVPEAGTWTAMLLGFGLMGAGLRTRRRRVRFA